MKIVVERRHTVRPENYEAVLLRGVIEIDSTEEDDKVYFEPDRTIKEIGKDLAEDLDDLLDTDVDRTLRLDGQHIEDTHLWVFYGID